MKTRLIMAAVAVLAAVGSAGADPRNKPHNEGGDVRVIGMGRMGVPWWMRQPGETEQRYRWRVIRMTQPFAPIRDGTPDNPPEDAPGDLPPG